MHLQVRLKTLFVEISLEFFRLRVTYIFYTNNIYKLKRLFQSSFFFFFKSSSNKFKSTFKMAQQIPPGALWINRETTNKIWGEPCFPLRWVNFQSKWGDAISGGCSRRSCVLNIYCSLGILRLICKNEAIFILITIIYHQSYIKIQPLYLSSPFF